jgi:hypothetical protein
MKCFIICFKKIALVAIQSRPSRIPGLSLGPRQAKAGVTLAMGQRRTSVASVIQPTAHHWMVDAPEYLACREGRRQHPDPRRRRVNPQESLGIERAVAAGAEAVGQRPQIELPDAEGFFADLVLRSVRAGRRSASLVERHGPPDEPSCGSVSPAAPPIPTRLALPVEKSLVSAENSQPNTVRESLETLLTELAHRHAQIFAVEARST